MPLLQAALGPGSHCTPWQCSGGQQPAPTARLGRSEGLWTPPHRHELAHSCRVPPVPPNSLCAGRGPPCTALGALAPPGAGHTPGQEDAVALPAAPAPLRMHGHVPMGLEVDGTPPKIHPASPQGWLQSAEPCSGVGPGCPRAPVLGVGRDGGTSRPPRPLRHWGREAWGGGQAPQIHKKLWLCYSVSLWYQEKVIIN